jgi:gentisate 1,2-dioxygenase
MFRALTVAAAAAALLTGAAASAQSADTLPNSDLKWREMIPNVVYFASAHGDWEKGAHAKFARVQPGATVPMHIHKQPYHAVLISGNLTNLLDSGPTRVELAPGDYWYMAGGRAHGHVCTSTEPCLVYTHSDGAWDLALVE